MDKLDRIFNMQRELANIIDSPRYPRVTEERISVLVTAIVHEAIELQRLCNWKWWKQAVPFKESEAKEELIDIWHFLIQASIEIGMTPNDILNEYKKKHIENKRRQRDGY